VRTIALHLFLRGGFVKKTPWWVLGPALAIFAASAAGCSASGTSTPSAAPAGGSRAGSLTPTPTPSLLSRANPNIVEEDEFHIVERLPKSDYIRVDDRHIRSPIIGPSAELYKEDENYYYIYTYKRNAETAALEQALRALTPSPTPSVPEATPTPAGPPLSDFEDLAPAREAGRIRLELVKAAGLPSSGLWRASFVVADMNGDGIPDIVAPSSRLGDAKLHIWIGDGKGHFSAWPLQFIEDGKPAPAFSLDYGGVAVGDIDGDGHMDVVTSSHGAGLVSLFGDGKGTFRVERRGLPTQDFSSQAIALADANGDGKLDIIASGDRVTSQNDYHQVRVYLYRGGKGWEYKPDGVSGGYISNSLHAWDFDRDGKSDVLTGSHVFGALALLWKNLGNGRFETVSVPQMEVYAYHYATVPGTFGTGRAAAFADAYSMSIINDPQPAHATGITVYSFEKGSWIRHRVWRKKSGQSVQYALAMGDLDGDGLDDVVFADSDVNRLRIFFQKPDGSFVEMAEKDEPALDSPGQCIRLADLDGDGRLDIILSKTVVSYRPEDQGGWNVYLNRR
jgi:FG-GAP-like repeat